MNTSYRRTPRPAGKPARNRNKKRLPFDPIPFLHPTPDATVTTDVSDDVKAEGMVVVDGNFGGPGVDSELGEHVIESVQICAMGSRDEQGRYIALETVSLKEMNEQA
ncbi:hypothetical protein BT69DRAFT_1341539 [Atractiella rhizophila]|nr:hypothetical protein BT69DRAFT_1341539 [Atractiella rhizophila]